MDETEKSKNCNEGQEGTAEGEKVQIETRLVPWKNVVGNEGRLITEVEQMSTMKADWKQQRT